MNIDACTVTVLTVHSHPLPYFLTSGTGGLQEAINANGTGQGANTVVLNAAWYELVLPTSAATVIASVHGNTSLGLVDVTTTPYTTYSWNGSAYAAVSNGSGPAVRPFYLYLTSRQPPHHVSWPTGGSDGQDHYHFSGSGNNATINRRQPRCWGRITGLALVYDPCAGQSANTNAVVSAAHG